MNLSALLLALTAPIVARVVVTLGFSVMSFAAIIGIMDGLVSYAQAQWSSIPLVTLQLAALSGIPEMLGTIMAAVVGKVSLWAVVSGTRYIIKAP